MIISKSNCRDSWLSFFALIEIENEDKGVAVNQATLTPLTIVSLYQIQDIRETHLCTSIPCAVQFYLYNFLHKKKKN